jgi:hypothetical protein
MSENVMVSLSNHEPRKHLKAQTHSRSNYHGVCMNITSNRPALFDKTAHCIWTDPPIQANLLAAHLNPRTDAASRRLAAIERTVAWLNAGIAPKSAILDLG